VAAAFFREGGGDAVEKGDTRAELHGDVLGRRRWRRMNAEEKGEDESGDEETGRRRADEKRNIVYITGQALLFVGVWREDGGWGG
jgi:hypothetical protein